MSDALLNIIIACVPIGVALVGIIPTIIANRKKTEDAITGFEQETKRTLGDLTSGVSKINTEISTIKDDVNTLRDDIIDVNVKIDGVDDSVTGLRENLKQHVKDDGEMQQKQRRVRILRFADEIKNGTEHTDDHWEEIKEDLDAYKKFCELNPWYENNKGKLTMQVLLDMYQERFLDQFKKENK